MVLNRDTSFSFSPKVAIAQEYSAEILSGRLSHKVWMLENSWGAIMIINAYTIRIPEIMLRPTARPLESFFSFFGRYF